MAKQKKKRSKKYQGSDAVIQRPTITRVEAANRSAFGQWWFEHKKVIKPVAIGAAIVLLIIFCIIEVVRFIHGGA